MKRYLSVPFALITGVALLRATAASTAEEPVLLSEFFVPGTRVAALEIVVPRGDLRPPEPNLGPELLAIPGVASQARAADAMEPSIRGLGFDRVATTLNGIALVNASPERTNSPVVILGPAAVTSLTVSKALPSVTLGPVTTGGQIALNTDPGAVAARGTPSSASVSTTYQAGRNGFASRGRFIARAGAWDATATFFANDLGDYTAADGRTVAARFEDHGASAAVGWHTGNHRARVEVIQRRLCRQETVSLPLDGKNTESQVVTLTDRWTNRDAGLLESFTCRAGYVFTDPYITSEDRKAPSLIFAQATARSMAAGVASGWRLGDREAVTAGFDFSAQSRRAIRTTAAGKDYIWPDALYRDLGAFAEWTHRFSVAWSLRLGGRADDVQSDVRDAGQLALGQPIRAQYVAYNGPEAGAVKRHDRVGATNALLQWKQGAYSAFAGVGLSAQPAPVMERYRAFLNALGGDGHGGNAVELGNPALHAERKSALEVGGAVRRSAVDLEATLFAYEVDDFILRTPIGTTTPPLARMVVFGYRNVDATFSGAELAATLKPGSSLSLPFTYAIVSGRNRTGGTGLSEIPPWEATAAIRWRTSRARRPIALETGTRLVGSRDNPAPLDNPLFAHTGGFAVWHARIGITLRRGLKLEAGLENMFDHAYSEYLTPPVAPFAPASGNLRPGDRVPAPGRSSWVSLTCGW